MKKFSLFLIILISFFACDEAGKKYSCSASGCIEDLLGAFNSLELCSSNCLLDDGQPSTMVTVFLYENCPIAQYMCGPLREAYRYFCDTLNYEILFRGFSPNSFSTQNSLDDFKIEYDIPFDVQCDYDDINNQPGPHTYFYNPVVTPELFIEFNDTLIYRGMIDNSYQSLGQWTMPTENFLVNVLLQIVNEEDISYFETEAIGCLINY